MSHDPSRHDGGPFIAAAFFVVGVGVMLIAAGVIPAKLNAPPAVVGAVGVAFAGAGAALLLRRWPRAGRTCAAATAFGLGVVFAWAAFTSQEPEVVSRGLSFLSAKAKQTFGRVLAGFAAALCFALAAVAGLRVIGGR